MIVLGLSTSLVTSFLFTATQSPTMISRFMLSFGKIFCWLILGLSLFKMSLEAAIFIPFKKNDTSFFKKSAILMTGFLKKFTVWRFIIGVIGGCLLPVIMLNIDLNETHAGLWLCLYSVVSLLMLVISETLERYLFFRAVVPLKMP